MKGLKLLILGLVFLIGLFANSLDVEAYGYYGQGYYGGYGYSGYGGYSNPYSYNTWNLWGCRNRYYDPGTYYATLNYASKNSMMDFSERNLDRTYGFISGNSWLN